MTGRPGAGRGTKWHLSTTTANTESQYSSRHTATSAGNRIAQKKQLLGKEGGIVKKEKRKSHNSLCALMGVVVVVVDTLEGGCWASRVPPPSPIYSLSPLSGFSATHPHFCT